MVKDLKICFSILFLLLQNDQKQIWKKSSGLLAILTCMCVCVCLDVGLNKEFVLIFFATIWFHI